MLGRPRGLVWIVSLLMVIGLTVSGLPSVRLVWSAVALTGADSPTLTVTPDSGRSLTPVLPTGRGYPPGVTVDFTFSEVPGAQPQVLAAVIVNSDGTLPPLQLTIPAGAAPGGVALISALWATPAAEAVSAPFAVTPTDRGLSVSPGAAQPGTLTVVSGTGFAPNAPLQVQLTDPSGAAIAVVNGATSSSTGALLPIGVTIPLTATTGLAVINAADNAGNVVGTPLVILPSGPAGQSAPSLVLNPIRAVTGEVVHFTASGLPAHAVVTLGLVDSTGNRATQSSGALPATDGTGQVQGAFIVPGSQAATGSTGSVGFTPPNGFSLGGNGGALLTVTLQAPSPGALAGVTVTAPLVIAAPRLAIFPPQGNPGQSFTIIGTGFGADEQVTVAQTDAGGVITQLGIAQTSDSGVFSLSGQYPALPAGAGPAGSALNITSTGEPSGLVATAVLAVHAAPSIALTPYIAPPGQDVLVSGASFPANTTVTIHLGLPGAVPGQETLLTAATDSAGAFTLPFTVPLKQPVGPVTIQVSTPNGTAVTGVLTVNDRSASVRASPLAVALGQSLTLQGQGFASGETLDLFLAQAAIPQYVAAKAGAFERQSSPLSGQPEILPGSLRTITADALGSFAASYPVGSSGARLQGAAYLLGVRGETSGRLALTAFGIAGNSSSSISTNPPPPACSGPTSTSVSSVGGSVQYMVTPLTTSLTGKAMKMTTQSRLLLANVGDQPAMITVAYLLAATKGKSPLSATSASGPVSVRTVSFDAAAHSVVTRQVHADSGVGQVVGIIVRAQPGTPVLDANGCPANPITASPAGDSPRIHAVLVTNRTRTALTGHGAVQMDAVLTNAVGQAGTGSGTDLGGPATQWYFAGGGAGGAYAEQLSLFNPQQDPAKVQVRALSATGLVGAVQTLTLAPFGLGSVRVRPPTCAKGKTGCAAEVGVVVVSTMQIVAARGLAWGIPKAEQSATDPWLLGTGIDLSSGTNQLSRQQFIPYASTANGDHAELAILNPTSCPAPVVAKSTKSIKNAKNTKTAKSAAPKTTPVPACAAVVAITAYTAFGAKVATLRVTVAGNTRMVAPLARTSGGLGVGSGVYALSVQSSLPVAVELAQYVGGGPGNTLGVGAHPGFEQLGVAGATTLTGAGVDTGGGMAVRLFNPTSGLMVMRVQGIGPAGSYFAQSYLVGAYASLSVTVPAPSGVGAGATGISISCSGPCVGTTLLGGAKPSPTSAHWGAILQ